MGDDDRQVVMELKSRLPPEVASRLEKLILYGSRARGDSTQDSDLDLVALVDEKTPALEEQLEEIAYRVMWDRDFRPIISLKVFSAARFHAAVRKGYSFYRHVEREGIEL